MGIADRWAELQDKVEKLCDELGRAYPTIIAVSKTRSLEEVQAAIDAGIEEFGENYAQELVTKAAHFPNVHWHFIGHLQRRHVKSIIPHTYMIHTIDRPKLVDRLSNLHYQGTCLLQVNISGEASKSGIEFKEETIAELLYYCKEKGLSVAGLMGIGGLGWSEQETYSAFSKLVAIGKSHDLATFSIGMSGDWKIALRAGATHLRIGTAIFGPRY